MNEKNPFVVGSLWLKIVHNAISGLDWPFFFPRSAIYPHLDNEICLCETDSTDFYPFWIYISLVFFVMIVVCVRVDKILWVYQMIDLLIYWLIVT